MPNGMRKKDEVEVVFSDGSKAIVHVPTQQEMDDERALFDAIWQNMKDAGFDLEIPPAP